jgi:hypothetical protein
MVAAGSARVRVAAFNAHLFGETARYFVKGQCRGTPFYYRDRERLPQIISGLRDLRAHVVGLTEVWDEKMGWEIADSLSDIYPYAYVSPSGPGIGGKLTDFYRDKKLLQWTPWFVDRYIERSCRYHYGASPKSLADEDVKARKYKEKYCHDEIWGPAIVVLSRYPMSYVFRPHSQRADWEQLANKGVFEAQIRLFGGWNVFVSLGHYQEGISETAQKVREDQIDEAGRRCGLVLGPKIFMGDLNVEKKKHPHVLARLQNRGFQEAPTERTYIEGNEFQKHQLGGKRVKETHDAEHVDYIYYGGGLVLQDSGVYTPLDGASDHRLVYADLQATESLWTSAESFVAQEDLLSRVA